MLWCQHGYARLLWTFSSEYLVFPRGCGLFLSVKWWRGLIFLYQKAEAGIPPASAFFWDLFFLVFLVPVQSETLGCMTPP